MKLSHPIQFLTFLLSVWASVLTPVHADEEWVYVLSPGDSLWNISHRYLKKGSYWKQLQQLNNVEDPYHMPPGSRIRIPLEWVVIEPSAATLEAVRGDVVLIRADGQQESSSLTGKLAKLGDRLETGKDAGVLIRFADDSLVSLKEQSTLWFDHLTAYSTSGMVDTRLRLSRGRADTKASKAAGAGSRFEIKTPSAISAVRGTEFRTAYENSAEVAGVEVLEGRVAVAGERAQRLVRAGFGTRVELGEKPIKPVPLLKAPVFLPLPDKIETLNWKLEWVPDSKAVGYRVELAQDAEFSITLWQQQILGFRVNLPDVADGHYYVRVRAIDHRGIEGLTGIAELLLDARPQPPLPVSPRASSVIYGAAPELSWTASSDAENYRVELSRHDDFRSIIVQQETGKTRFQLPESVDYGHYYWRVFSLANGEAGPVYVQPGFTLKPVPATPVPQMAEDETEVELKWQLPESGQNFHYQIATDSDFSELINDESQASNAITIPRPEGNPLYFRVRTVEADGYAGPWGATQTIPAVVGDGWIYMLSTILFGVLLL